ncbi:hypothetical protein [Cytobacillus firmus]|nr:hypothetical protein [Cytobacillus firmus]
MQIDCWNLQIEWGILQIEQFSTHTLPALIVKEDKLIPVSEFGRCDV